jgi:NAD(P)-dependent dehydrogenase (short-subunit alcohol dehydrogenase family)
LKNILIIGASSGIGRKLAEDLSLTNNVTGTYNNNAVTHDSIKYTYYDVEATEQIDGLPDVIDGLVYCPGKIDLRPFGRIKSDDFIKDYQIQVVGAIKVIQQVLPLLKKSDNASIVLFSTVAVQTGFTFHSLVSSSKGAIEGLTKALAAEFAPKIRVNCIAPSLTNTPLAAQLLATEEKIAANAQRHPMKRVGSSADIASLAAFLLSDQSSWITGQIIHVDGGISSLKV